MMHDDNPMCKSEFGFTELKNHVMSPTMESIDSAQPWSHCSRKAILNFLQDKRGECLRDRPQQETVKIFILIPTLDPQSFPNLKPQAVWIMVFTRTYFTRCTPTKGLFCFNQRQQRTNLIHWLIRFRIYLSNCQAKCTTWTCSVQWLSDLVQLLALGCKEREIAISGALCPVKSKSRYTYTFIIGKI